MCMKSRVFSVYVCMCTCTHTHTDTHQIGHVTCFRQITIFRSKFLLPEHYCHIPEFSPLLFFCFSNTQQRFTNWDNGTKTNRHKADLILCLCEFHEKQKLAKTFAQHQEQTNPQTHDTIRSCPLYWVSLVHTHTVLVCLLWTLHIDIMHFQALTLI